MKVAVLGAGFTGLTASLRLLQLGHQVTLFEKEAEVGGLAMGFHLPGWEWTLEKAYHHWFTNDDWVLNLCRELNYPVIIKRPLTNVLANQQAYQLDSPLSLLAFPHLPFIDRIRTGLALAYLKVTNDSQGLNKHLALTWIRRTMGPRSAELIWEPLFTGKFGRYKEEISLTWFWARIKKRTPKLAYPEGGFQTFAQRVEEEIKNLNGEISLGTVVTEIRASGKKCQITVEGKQLTFDKVIVTLPSPVFSKVTGGLPQEYTERISSIPHLSAQNLILILKKPFFDKTYWLNITDTSFPFLVMAEHTNFMDPGHYGNQHILYIGNYLPPDHEYFKLSADKLLDRFDSYLKKINPNYRKNLAEAHLFNAPFAQPVVTRDYPTLIPEFKTPLPNIYLANMDMVYPWDRGTNYAVEMGEKIARIVDSNEEKS